MPPGRWSIFGTNVIGMDGGGRLSTRACTTQSPGTWNVNFFLQSGLLESNSTLREIWKVAMGESSLIGLPPVLIMPGRLSGLNVLSTSEPEISFFRPFLNVFSHNKKRPIVPHDYPRCSQSVHPGNYDSTEVRISAETVGKAQNCRF